MSDERQDSLAAQMGAWVPPWERNRDELDRDFQEEAEETAAEETVPEAVDAPQELPADDEPEPEVPLPDSIEEAAEEAPAEDAPDEPAPVDEPARPEAEVTGYLAGFHDTAARLASEPVAEITPVAAEIPAQATGPRGGEDDGRTEEKVLDGPELAAALEAILLVVDEPTNELKLAEVLEQPVERVARALDDISARYTAAGHGFDLRRAAGGWRLYTRPEYATYVERFVLDGQSTRLTQAALETLAVVAYKQPVTRSRISAIRGVNCDGVMRTLVTRGLIEEVGTEPETGAYLYRTTALFLEKLGLNSVDQLPPLAPFLPDDVEEVLDASG
ncbi:SMC-Scp complex subunit ScpB [Actinoplanes sp. L3-i22]|uniref:SMC-Scp complex subunit ScpB n=1 Tax=Actinoplanes sp. L3-i22 TaxID=2836373 RepID=UPI001C770B59|nr:SMC-Scp complex subunit ScpB [Actinoplanes sp. L3-i22]BCY13500.1 hypothetical protein L3i22_085880 [Actinoplanes sp. L3-i22]